MVASPPRENIPLYQAVHGGVPADFLTTGSGVGDYIYFRQPNGWLTVAPVGKNSIDLHQYQDEGWAPLREYGGFDFPREYYTNHPFEVLFLRGGAHEMPVEQIKALGFDRRPPLLPRCTLALGDEHHAVTRRMVHFARCWMGAQPVAFPQLAGTTPVAVPKCEFCEREDFTSAKGREQHMRVLHIDELREIAAAREMSRGFEKAIGKLNMSNAAGVGLPIAGMAAQPFACGLCGETFASMRGRNPENSLEAHVKLHEDSDTPDSTDEPSTARED